MKRLLIRLIHLYQYIARSLAAQAVFPFSLSGCRSWPTCSEYSITMIEQYGIVRGGQKSIVRLLHCHPLSTVQ